MELYRRFKDTEGGRKVPLSPYWYVDLTDAQGLRVRVSTRCKDKRQAMLRATELQQAQLDRAQQIKDGKEAITLADALNAYVARLESRRKPSVIQARTLRAKLLGIGEAFEGRFRLDGSMFFHDLKAHHLEKLKDAREAEGNAPQTIAHEIKVLRAAYGLAREKECYRVPEIVKWRAPTIVRKTRYLSREEVAKLYDSLSPDRLVHGNGRTGKPLAEGYALTGARRSQMQDLQDLIVMLALTGGRWGEVTGLRWAQVDMAARTISIFATKTQKERLVPIPEPAMVVLRRRIAERSDAGALVFPNRAGGQRQGSNKAMHRAINACGLNSPEMVARHGRATVHSLRHTYASFLLQNGADLAEVQEALGHANVQMTRRYAHLSKSKTLARLSGIMENVSASLVGDPPEGS